MAATEQVSQQPVTFRQYASAVRDAKRSEYGITVAEATECFPDSFLRPRWVKGLLEMAQSGVALPASMARTLTEAERYYLSKFGYTAHGALVITGGSN